MGNRSLEEAATPALNSCVKAAELLIQEKGNPDEDRAAKLQLVLEGLKSFRKNTGYWIQRSENAKYAHQEKVINVTQGGETVDDVNADRQKVKELIETLSEMNTPPLG
jgi:hypothetical protein